jgi:hypothetical protein
MQMVGILPIWMKTEMWKALVGLTLCNKEKKASFGLLFLFLG